MQGTEEAPSFSARFVGVWGGLVTDRRAATIGHVWIFQPCWGGEGWL